MKEGVNKKPHHAVAAKVEPAFASLCPNQAGSLWLAPIASLLDDGKRINEVWIHPSECAAKHVHSRVLILYHNRIFL
jgi:hypothetical protein